MRNQKGTTLVELVIYIGIVGMILTTVSMFLLNLLTTRAKTAAITETLANGRLVQERLTEAMRHASGIVVLDSEFGTDPGVLSLEMADLTLSPTIFSLNEDDGQVQVSEGGLPPVTLTTNDVHITDFQFQNLTSPEDVGIIQLQFTIEVDNPSLSPRFDYAQSFQTTARIPLGQ